MKPWLLLPIGITGIACMTTTTTVGSLSDGAARRWLNDNASSDMTIETKDRPSGLDDVRVEAISPTDIRFHARSGEVVPADHVRRVTVRNHGQGALEGTLLGAGAGVAFGLVFGLLATTRPSNPTDCDICSTPFETGVLAGVLFGVPMMVVSAISGAITGHEDVLEVK